MAIQPRKIPVSFLIRRSVRYLLVSNGFRLLQVVVVLAMLSLVLTGSRIAAIDGYGNRTDIVAAIFVTIATIALLRTLNRRVMTAIDRRFFREAYNAEQVLTELGEAIPTLSKTNELVELVADKISAALHPENVTIFLDDQDAGAYVAAVSTVAAKAGAALEPGLGSLVLYYDGKLITRLTKSDPVNSVEITEADLWPQHPPAEGRDLSDHERRVLRGINSSLLIPIASNGRLYGLISLGRRLSDLQYATEDKRLLAVVGNQIATFIENRKMIHRMAAEEVSARELKMAAEVQRHLFPADGLETEALEIYGTCLPALGVGGDYYDYFEMDKRRTGIAIADVAGKGIAAALLMSTVQASLRCQLISQERSLGDVASAMNSMLRRSTDDRGYATFFFAEFDGATRDLTYVNAGHNPPMLVRGGPGSQRAAAELHPVRRMGTSAGLDVSVSDGPVVRLLTTGGPIIGTFLDEPYEQEVIQLRRGDLLAVYTDGVTEALNPAGIEFGEERLRSILVECLQLSARKSVEVVIVRVLEWQGLAPQHDDITLIVVKVR